MKPVSARRLRARFDSTQLLLEPLESRVLLSTVLVPTNVTALGVSASSIQVRWGSMPSNTGYVVQRSADGSTAWTLAGQPSTNTTTLLDRKLSAGTTYYYRVQTQSAAGPSAYSTVAAGTTLCIAPSSLQWTNCAPTTIILAWSNVVGESGYIIERSPNNTSGWAQVGSTGMDVNTFTDGNLPSAATYYYRVKAVNVAGTSQASRSVRGLTATVGAHVTQGRITALDWAAPTSPLATQTGMITVWVNGLRLNANGVLVNWSGTTDSSAYDNQIAAWAAQSKAQPAGQAALRITALDALTTNPLDCCVAADGTLTTYLSPWWDHGMVELQAQIGYFFAKFHADGGRADYIIDDDEVWGLSNSNIQAIQADARSAAWVQAMGLEPNIFNDVLAGNTDANYAWNNALNRVLNTALNTAEFNVAAQYFPNARMSNYNNFIMTAPNVVPDPSDWYQYSTSVTGNRQTPALYGYIAARLAGVTMPGTAAPYGNSAFATLRYTVNTMRAVALSSTTAIDPWIAGPGYTGSLLTNTPYYQEAIYHEALAGAESFLYWNPTPIATDAQNTMVDRTLTALNQVLGTGPRWSVTPAEMPWDSPLIVSGMQTATRVVWRVTAPPGTQQIKVVETGVIINVVGSVGAWYTSPVGQSCTFVIVS